MRTLVSKNPQTIYSKLPTKSSQIIVVKQEQEEHQLHLEDLLDVSYIIMSPTTPDKEDIIIGSESEKHNS